MSRYAPFIALGLVLATGCDDSGDSTAARDGATDADIPAACQVPASGPVPHIARFRVRNVGASTLFVTVAYSCSVALSVSSCSSNYSDQLVQEYGICPCTGSCPVGGAGCPADGRAIPPGGAEEKVWGATVPILTTKNGQQCHEGARHLPAGRYRVSLGIFASQADAKAAAGGRNITHEFELRGGSWSEPQIVDLPVSLDDAADAGAQD